jgi:glucosylglycerate synthase
MDAGNQDSGDPLTAPGPSLSHPIMRKGAQRQLKRLRDADLVIGLPTYANNPKLAARVAQTALEGARRYFPDLRTVLVNADAGLKSYTRREITSIPVNGQTAIVADRYQATLGRGSAVAAVLDAGLALGAKAIVILDGHTTSVTPAWLPGLAELILDERADLVMPRYHWPLAEGALSDLIFYPLCRALWGISVRHPAAGDCGLSASLAETLLERDVWQTEVARFGFEIWLTSLAATEGWRLAQTALGEKRYRPRRRATHLRMVFQDTVGVLLRQIGLRQKYWHNVSRFDSTPTLTKYADKHYSEPTLETDYEPLVDSLALGWIDYRDLWQRIMLPENLATVEALASLTVDRFHFPPNLWARLLYDYAVVYNKGERDPNRIADSLFPLYQGRLASFWQEVAGLTGVGREGTVAAQAVEFEHARGYLEQRWEEYRPWLHSGEKR